MGATMEDMPVLAMEEGGLDLPPGFRFHPTDEEIITCYLLEKAMNKGFIATAIGEVDLNRNEPWDLPSKAKMGEKEWYFFCQRDRKYPTGMRTNRATEAGYWKATGKDKEIYKRKNCLVGMKKTLVFYKGRAPKGEKSNWVMHEFRLEGKSLNQSLPKGAKDAWVVCRVFHKNIGEKKIPSPLSEPGRTDLLAVKTSFEDDYVDSPPLPSLLDSPYYSANRAASTFIGVGDGGDFKTAPSASFNPYYFPSVESLQDLQNCLLDNSISTYPNSNNYQVNLQSPPQLGSVFYPQPSFPSPSRSLQSSPSMAYLQHAMLRAQVAPQERETALRRQHCNMEQHSNQSLAISASQDTGLSTDRNTEISSVVSKHGASSARSHDDVNCPSSSGQASYPGTFWKY